MHRQLFSTSFPWFCDYSTMLQFYFQLLLIDFLFNFSFLKWCSSLRCLIYDLLYTILLFKKPKVRTWSCQLWIMNCVVFTLFCELMNQTFVLYTIWYVKWVPVRFQMQCIREIHTRTQPARARLDLCVHKSKLSQMKKSWRRVCERASQWKVDRQREIQLLYAVDSCTIENELPIEFLFWDKLKISLVSTTHQITSCFFCILCFTLRFGRFFLLPFTATFFESNAYQLQEKFSNK